MNQKYQDRKLWFFTRIGKRVFRNPGTCDCTICRRVESDGLIIGDEFHASYLFDMEMELRDSPDDKGIKYFDTKEEADNY